jgi:tetratricopeptide (TPR) repeat protein
MISRQTQDFPLKEPTTVEEAKNLHDLCRKDPQRYLGIVNAWLSDDPQSHRALFDRHRAWMNLGEPHRALADLDSLMEISPNPTAYLARGEVHRHLGEYERAIEDFARCEAMIPEEWCEVGFGLLFEADCRARLGDLKGALACCARLPDDFWTPGLYGAPAGDKTAIEPALRQIAASARRSQRD